MALACAPRSAASAAWRLAGASAARLRPAQRGELFLPPVRPSDQAAVFEAREALVAREAIVPAQVTLTNARATQIQQIAKRDSGATASDPALVAALARRRDGSTVQPPPHGWEA